MSAIVVKTLMAKPCRAHVVPGSGRLKVGLHLLHGARARFPLGLRAWSYAAFILLYEGLPPQVCLDAWRAASGSLLASCICVAIKPAT